tara:strand:- start:87 stop:281 length:195 start_codon:yes stop_codon:yes gene_type:complete
LAGRHETRKLLKIGFKNLCNRQNNYKERVLFIKTSGNWKPLLMNEGFIENYQPFLEKKKKKKKQ